MENTLILKHAETTEEITACFDVMQQLRSQLLTPDDFLARVAIQRTQGYRLLAAWEDDKPVALAGYRHLDNMIHGRFIYVDDLVTDAAGRRKGLGELLLNELRSLGRAERCDRLVLDTALTNALAQRFYSRVGLLARGLHLSMDLQ
jgi:ribosomal protein S18 acetylase RimI-like enzyme